MFNLIKRYFSDTKFIFAASWLCSASLYYLLFALPNITLSIICLLALYGVTTKLLSLLGWTGTPFNLLKPVFIICAAVAGLSSALLFLNAIPYLGLILAVTTFISSFEVLVRWDLDERFSLVKLLLNPRGRLEALYPVEDERLLGFLHQQIIIRILFQNAVDNQNHNYQAYPGLWTNPAPDPTPNRHYSSLKLSETDNNTLITRQQNAIVALPEALRQAHRNISRRVFTPKHDGNIDEETSIMLQKKAEFQAYRGTLTHEQQLHFDVYLERTLGLLHKQCNITLEVPTPNTARNFVVVQKEYLSAGIWHAVPECVDVYQGDATLASIFQPKRVLNPNTLQYENQYQHPTTRDQFFSPSTYPNSLQPGQKVNRSSGDISNIDRDEERDLDTYKYYDSKDGAHNETRYRYHPYQLIDGHPLSLSVCEATEAFNASLNPQHAVSSTAAHQRPNSGITNYRNQPLARHSTIATLNMYQHENLNMDIFQDGMSDEAFQAVLNRVAPRSL